MILDDSGFEIIVTGTPSGLGGGRFKGTGIITLPFLNNYGVKIVFDRMYVNTLRQVTQGGWTAVSRSRQDWIRDKLGTQGVIVDGTVEPGTKIDFAIDPSKPPQAVEPPPGKVGKDSMYYEIYGANGEKTTVAVPKPSDGKPSSVVITYGNGESYSLTVTPPSSDGTPGEASLSKISSGKIQLGPDEKRLRRPDDRCA